MGTIEDIFEKAINDIKNQKKALSKDLVIAKLLIIKEQVIKANNKRAAL